MNNMVFWEESTEGQLPSTFNLVSKYFNSGRDADSCEPFQQAISRLLDLHPAQDHLNAYTGFH